MENPRCAVNRNKGNKKDNGCSEVKVDSEVNFWSVLVLYAIVIICISTVVSNLSIVSRANTVSIVSIEVVMWVLYVLLIVWFIEKKPID